MTGGGRPAGFFAGLPSGIVRRIVQFTFDRSFSGEGHISRPVLRFLSRAAILMAVACLTCPKLISQQPNQNGRGLPRSARLVAYAPLSGATTRGFFSRKNIEVSLVPAIGATVPRVNDAVPLGLIGAPAALMQAVHGTDLKLIASFYRARSTGNWWHDRDFRRRRRTAESVSECE